jgi:hypothetical protein
VARGTVDAELARHFVVPLPNQGGRAENEDPFGHTTQDVFLQYHPSLDGLAEPSAISPWIDRRQKLDIIRDKLGEGEMVPLQQQELTP